MTRPRVRRLVGCLLLAMLLGSGCTASTGGERPGDDTDLSFTASDGTTSRYHVFGTGLDSDRPAGLLLYFHGDDATEFTEPDSGVLGGDDGLVPVAREHELLTVAVLTPDRDGLPTWWESGERNAEYVAELLGTVRRDYDFATDDIWLVGYSGGSQFITQFFLPRHSAAIEGGGAVLFGGGGRPYNVTELPYSATLRQNFPMHWYTGTDDDGTDSVDGYDALGDPVHGARAGETYYAEHGFRTSHEWPADTGHDLSGHFGPVLADRLDATG